MKIFCRAAESGWSEGDHPDGTCSVGGPDKPSVMGKKPGSTGFRNRLS